MLGKKPPWLGQDEEVQQTTGKAEIAAKMEGLVMSWWKIAFCIAGYLFAWAAVAGFYDQMHKDKADGFEGFGFLIGAGWPLYIAFIPLHAVYKSVKAQMIAQVERAKEAAEPSVPPGKFRIGSCKTCAYAVDRTEDYVWCKKNGGAFCKGERCEEYKSAPEKKERKAIRWTRDEYALALALALIGYDTLCTTSSRRAHASANGKDPFFLPLGMFSTLEPHKCVSIQDIVKEAEEGQAKGLKWRGES